MTVEVVFGWPARHKHEGQHAFPVVRPDRTLCGIARDEGRMAAFIPAEQQDGLIPHDLCARCAAVMAAQGARPVRTAEAEGVCPACGGNALLDAEGRVAGHRAWMVGRHGPRVSQVACGGAGQWPEAG